MTQKLIDAAEREKALEFVKLARRDLAQIKGNSALDWANQSLIIVMAKTGDVIGAKKFADEIADIGARISALTIIVENQADQGDQVSAQRILAEAVELVGKLSREKAGWSCGVAMAQAHIGDIEGAIATVDRMDAGWARVSMLVAIAKAQWRVGDRISAMASYSAARDGLAGEIAGVVDYNLIQVVESEVWTGDYAWAREAICRIKDPIKQAQGLLAIGRAQTHAGDSVSAMATLSEALETLPGAEMERWHEGRCVRVLSDIAQATAEAGDVPTSDEIFAEALILAGTIASEGNRRPWALSDVALAQKAVEAAGWKATLESAMRALDEMGKPEDRVATLWMIAYHFAQNESIDVASELVNRAVREKVAGSDPWKVGLVARAMAWEGVKADLSWIDRLKTAEEKALAYSGAAVGIIGL